MEYASDPEIESPAEAGLRAFGRYLEGVEKSPNAEHPASAGETWRD
jgi:hypothetical protein